MRSTSQLIRWLAHRIREQARSHILIGVCQKHFLLMNVIATLAVASLLAQFSGIVPEDPRLHVLDLVQAVHAAPLGTG
ncbi:hypothetical protein NHF39_07475 [Pseudomonas proteolytica]|nr:hypothetical protein NHF39_07475 [Pseudomonas proteolytica]